MVKGKTDFFSSGLFQRHATAKQHGDVLFLMLLQLDALNFITHAHEICLQQ